MPAGKHIQHHGYAATLVKGTDDMLVYNGKTDANKWHEFFSLLMPPIQSTVPTNRKSNLAEHIPRTCSGRQRNVQRH
jgi:hypothetical protein